MCFENTGAFSIICPHLKGSRDGASCDVVKDYLRNIANVNIKFCLSKHYEICHVYRSALKREIISPIEFSC